MAQREPCARADPDRCLHPDARTGGRRAPRVPSQRDLKPQRTYEQYLALARAEAQIGNTVGARNYYQHAEHYFRLMSSDRRGT
jgi:Domain of unknown function (DUF4167)